MQQTGLQSIKQDYNPSNDITILQTRLQSFKRDYNPSNRIIIQQTGLQSIKFRTTDYFEKFFHVIILVTLSVFIRNLLSRRRRRNIFFIISVFLYIYFLITREIYELSHFDHVLGVMSQTRISAENRSHDPYGNSLVHYPLNMSALILIISFQCLNFQLSGTYIRLSYNGDNDYKGFWNRCIL